MKTPTAFFANPLCGYPLAAGIRQHSYRLYAGFQSHRWNRPLADFTRYTKIGAALAAVFVAVLVVAARIAPAPLYFVLDKGHQRISAPELPAWHQFSNWVKQRKYAVLTFDDGPIGDGLDEQFLAILARHHAHAMFFLVCNRIDAKTSAILGKMERDGHLIGNHSLEHKQLSKLPYSEVLRQIDSCNSQIASATGHRPHFFRAPWGQSSPDISRAAGMAGVQQVSWDANSYDVLFREPGKIAEVSVAETNDMSILLMHEGKTTAAALDGILTQLEERGFTFVLPNEEPQEVHNEQTLLATSRVDERKAFLGQAILTH